MCGGGAEGGVFAGVSAGRGWEAGWSSWMEGFRARLFLEIDAADFRVGRTGELEGGLYSRAKEPIWAKVWMGMKRGVLEGRL